MNCKACKEPIVFKNGIEIWHTEYSVGFQYICNCGAVNQVSFGGPFHEGCYKDGKQIDKEN